MRFISELKRAQFCTLALVIFASGCGGAAPGGYKGPKGTVSGRMMIGGAPLKEGCQVMFQSVEGGHLATGTVKSEGKYTLTSNGSFDVPAVAYRVQLSPVEVFTASRSLDDGRKSHGTVRLSSCQRSSEASVSSYLSVRID
jgi:hypothetical protein